MITRLNILTASVLVVAFLFGCGGGDDQTTSAGAEATGTASAEADLPEPVSVAGAERLELSDRLLTKVSISDGPDWMVAAFGSLWVKRDDGFVVRIDPQTGKTVAEIPPTPGVSSGPPEHSCQGIGASEEAIWSCPPGGNVVRIDPETNSVVATVRIDKFADQGRIVSAADRVWVLTDLGAKLTAIDERTNKPSTTVSLGARCFDLAAAGTTVWAMCPLDNLVLRVDAEAGEISDELTLAGATNASVSDQLWVAFEGGVAQVDPETLEVLGVYEVYPSSAGTTYATPDAVWVREEGERFLTRIDPASQRIVETIRAPELPSGGDVVQIGNSVWATAFDDATLVELRASG